MHVLSTFAHLPSTHNTHSPSSLLAAIQQCVQQSAQGIRSVAGNIPLHKIAKVIYYGCMIVGFATFFTAATASVIFSVPIAQIAVFVAQYLGALALAPLMEQIVIAASVSGVTGVVAELAWTKHQVARLTVANGALAEERNTANAERVAIAAQRDAISVARELVVIERDTATALMETVVAQRDTAIAGRDAAFAERDAAIDERDTSIDENTNLASRVAALEDDMRQLVSRINASLSSPAADPAPIKYAPAGPAPSAQDE
ncbi:hypothetical protein BGW39_011200 [Mortierella sp. 14UC]|nr:hypothetical protein BGW39_011200 [Mortierella sp. 14UC]